MKTRREYSVDQTRFRGRLFFSRNLSTMDTHHPFASRPRRFDVCQSSMAPSKSSPWSAS